MDDFIRDVLTSIPAQNNIIEAGISELLEDNPKMTREEAFKIATARLEEMKKEAGLME